MIIYKKYYFDAAHFMTNFKKGHKYTKVHGHSYEMIIKISGNLDKTNNWILNYDDIDEIVNPLLQKIDHKTLNDIKDMVKRIVINFDHQAKSKDYKYSNEFKLKTLPIKDMPTYIQKNSDKYSDWLDF